MNTRTEVINGYTYCAYCGKELKNPHYSMYPEPPTICDCEKAKEELDLYKKLRDLYNAPLAESLIDKKVQKYRNELLGIKEPVCYSNLVSVSCVDGTSLSSGFTNGKISAHSIELVDGKIKIVND